MINNIKDNIKGLFFGQALGDAIGLCTEYMTKEEITKKYNTNIFTSHTKISDYHRDTWANGDWTDDTDTFICIVKSIIETKSADIKCFAKYFNDWLENGLKECNDKKCHGAGNTTTIWYGEKYNLSDPIRAGVRMLIYDPFRKFENASNGALMRCSILGAFKYNDRQQIIKNTIENCMSTHASPKCVISCVFYNLFISDILNNKVTFENSYRIKGLILKECETILHDYCDKLEKLIKDESKNILATDPFFEVITTNVALFSGFDAKYIFTEFTKYVLATSLIELDLNDNIGYVFKTLSCSLISLQKLLSDLEKCSNIGQCFHNILSNLTMQGGDSDTNCAVTGALLGAYIGFNNIPTTLLDELIYKKYLTQLYDEYILLFSD